MKSHDTANTGEFELPVSPFKIANKGGELIIRLMRRGSGAVVETILLLEEKRYASPKLLESLNLTSREAEILFWMTFGKTFVEIGEVLFISPRTVHKHTEHIYTKLGVETRTAAITKALEILR